MIKRVSKDWKLLAREALQGNFNVPVLATLAMFALSMLLTEITSFLFPGSEAVTMVLSHIFSFILTLILGVLSAGISYLMLQIARRKEYNFADIFYFFKHHPDRVIVAAFVLGILNEIASIPYIYAIFTMEMGNTYEEILKWSAVIMGTMIFEVVVNTILTLPLSMTYLILADDQEIGGIDALKTSFRMMKGNIRRYLFLQISFIPLLLLAVFTCYIALLWLIPYMDMAAVMFYRDLKGELDKEPPRLKEDYRYQSYPPVYGQPLGQPPVYGPQDGSYPENGGGEKTGHDETQDQIPVSEGTQKQSQNERPGDDYNSEA